MNQSKLKKKKGIGFTYEEYLLFLIGNNNYACPLKKVREIINFRIPFPMQNMPRFCKGFIVHREQTIIIFDLREKFDNFFKENNENISIIILELPKGVYIGTIVDHVDKVEKINLTNDDEENINIKKTRITKKVICLDGLIIQVLDLKKLLS